MYDVLIVGAGPGGIFTAYELKVAPPSFAAKSAFPCDLTFADGP